LAVCTVVQVIEQVETAPLKAEQARDYELLEARVRDRIASRPKFPIRQEGGR
jgi:hypothetical protein